MHQAIRNYLEEMRSEYGSLPIDELKLIDWVDRDPVTLQGKNHHPSIWTEKLTDEKFLLVVQLTRWRFFRFYGTTDCIGILFYPSGKKEYVDENYLMNEIGHP